MCHETASLYWGNVSLSYPCLPNPNKRGCYLIVEPSTVLFTNIPPSYGDLYE